MLISQFGAHTMFYPRNSTMVNVAEISRRQRRRQQQQQPCAVVVEKAELMLVEAYFCKGLSAVLLGDPSAAYKV